MEIAQNLQIDKIYHQKEQKISYLGEYITNLGRESPGEAILGWKSTGLYPNVSVALDTNAKLSGSFKNAKSRFRKDFYAKISDLFKKPKETHFGWVFYSF